MDIQINKNLQGRVEEYLKSFLLPPGTYTLSPKEKRKVEHSPVDFMVEKLARKKFRRRALAPATREAIRQKVSISVEQNRPIHLVIPFGGYKHFWNSSHPLPDWAELFNQRYLADYLAPVLAVHEAGVIIEYVSEGLILPTMNNYPPRAIKSYAEAFQKTIAWQNSVSPPGLEFRFRQVSDQVDTQKLIDDVLALIPERRAAFDKLSAEEQDRELHRSARSFMWNGAEDFTGLGEGEKREKVISSRLIELAYYDTEAKPEYFGEYLWEDNHICVCFSFGTTHDNDEFQDLTLGSTYGSVVDHWIGRGVLRQVGGRFIPDILSKTQYEKVADRVQKVQVGGIFDGENYREIDVVLE